jgi:NADPH:quinone reductase-like Zn-dependent oxidoreductase
MDVVLDLVGDESTRGAIATLRDDGLFIVVPSAAGLGDLLELAGDRVRVTGILVEPDRTGMESLAQLAATGALRPHVSHTFPLAHAAQAHELGETGRTQGKLVLTPA